MLERSDAASRTERRRSRRRRRVAARAFGTVALAAAIGAGLWYVSTLATSPDGDDASAAGARAQRTLLVAMTSVDDLSQQADSLTLFAADADGTDPVGLFVPAGTFGQIPGQSSIESIGKALIFGRETLQQTAVENLLGIKIDHTLILSDVTLARVVEAVGGIDIEVAEELFEPDAQGRQTLVFPLGPAHMSGAQALTYMTYMGEGETELDRYARAQKVWEALFAAADADELRAAVASAPDLLEPDAEALAAMLAAFASATPDDRAFDVLPVETVSGGLDQVYKVDEEAASHVLMRHFSGSFPPGVTDPAARPRVELLNGTGTPELGGSVARVLVPAGIRVAVTGNADRFGYARTRIIVYGDDASALALGERLRELLGVGEVEIGRRGQTVVDATIVVGGDFEKKD